MARTLDDHLAALKRAQEAGAPPSVIQTLEARVAEAQAAQGQDDTPGRLESMIRGGMQGFTFGGADEMAGMLGDDRENIRARNAAAKEAYPEGYGTAQIIGGVGGALTGGGLAARAGLMGAKAAPGLLRMMGLGAAEGAAAGAGYADADEFMSPETAVGAGVGAVVGAGTGAAGKGVVSGARALKNLGQRVRNPDIAVAEKFQEAAEGRNIGDFQRELSPDADMKVADMDPQFRATLDKASRNDNRRKIREVLDGRHEKGADRVAKTRGSNGLESRERRMSELDGAVQRHVQTLYDHAEEVLDPHMNVQIVGDAPLAEFRTLPRFRTASESVKDDLLTEFGPVSKAEIPGLAQRMADDAGKEAKDFTGSSAGAFLAAKHPTKYLDALQRKLEATAQGANREGHKATFNAIQKLRGKVMDATDDMASAYKAPPSRIMFDGVPESALATDPLTVARRTAEVRFKGKAAEDIGRDLLTTKHPKDAFATIEKKGFLDIPEVHTDLKTGVFEGLESAVADGSLSQRSIDKLVNPGPSKTMMTKILGEKGLRTFEQRARTELKFIKTNAALQKATPTGEMFPGMAGRTPIGGTRLTGIRSGEMAIDAGTAARRASQTDAVANSMMLGRDGIPRIEDLLKPQQTPNPRWEYGAASPVLAPFFGGNR